MSNIDRIKVLVISDPDKAASVIHEHTKVIDWGVYVQSNPDLVAANVVDGFGHYFHHGHGEPRVEHTERVRNAVPTVQLPADWDWQKYVAAHKDLQDAGIDTQEEAESHYLTFGYKEPGRWPVKPPTPPTPPTPTGDIKSFENVDALDDPDNCYFTGCRVNGDMNFATYKDGSYTARIKKIDGEEIGSFNAESCFMIIPFNGSYNMSQEHGKYATVDRGMIWRLNNGVWKEVYRHPRWTLMTEMHVNQVDGYLYASGCSWENLADPAGIVRSADGENFSVWFENENWYRFWGMTSRPNGSLVIAAASGGRCWDMEAKDCSPCVFENGNNLIWRDDDHRGSGFWAAEYWHGDVYLGRCGEAAVVRLSDRKTVLDMPGFEAIHDLAIDKVTDTLYAFCTKASGTGCMVKATKDGDNWYSVGGPLDIPHIIDGWWDDTEKTLFLCGGEFAGKGRVKKGVR